MLRDSQPLFKLPVNAITIMTLIDRDGPQTQTQLFNTLDFTHRVLRYTLRRMEMRGVIRKQANFFDMRSPHYIINPDVVGYDLQQFFQEEGLTEATI